MPRSGLWERSRAGFHTKIRLTVLTKAQTITKGVRPFRPIEPIWVRFGRQEVIMGKPVQDVPVLTGQAAQEMREYLDRAKPTPEKAERNRKAVEFYRGVKTKD